MSAKSKLNSIETLVSQALRSENEKYEIMRLSSVKSTT